MAEAIASCFQTSEDGKGNRIVNIGNIKISIRRRINIDLKLNLADRVSMNPVGNGLGNSRLNDMDPRIRFDKSGLNRRLDVFLTLPNLNGKSKGFHFIPQGTKIRGEPKLL